MRTFVLIPGAGGAAWYWSRVVPLLRAAGHTAIAVDLPADDEHEGLEEYAKRVLEVIDGNDDVAIVAQSLGGFTAAVVCDRTAVASLTFVNAMIPLPGEAAGEWWEHTGWPEARQAAAAAGGYGDDVYDAMTYFLHDVPADVVAEGEAHQRPEAEAVFTSPCEFRAWPAIPIRVLAGADDRFFPPAFQREVARRRLGVEADIRPGGHLIALAQPQAVADYLMQRD